MSNVKFSQLPDLPQGSITPATIVPVVEGGVNYTVTTANLQSYVNSTTGNVTAGNVLSTGIVSATGNVRGGNLNTGGVVSATGNITGSFFLGNGSQLTGLPAVYGNANVANFLANYGSNTISSTGNVTANIMTASSNIDVGNFTKIRGNSLTIQTVGTNGTVTADIINGLTISASGNITGNYILGNGSQLSGLPATYGNANVTTLLANLGSNTISSTGNITTTANVSGNYILGNGSQLTGIAASYGDANVSTLLASFGSNTISTTGNVTAGNFIGNGAALTGIVTSAGSFISSGNNYANANASTSSMRIHAGPSVALSLPADSLILSTGGNGAASTSTSILMSPGGNISINPGGNSISALNTVTISGVALVSQLICQTGTANETRMSSSGLVAGTANFSTNMTVPVYTIAGKPGSGAVGQIISISNSPTQAGKMAYWSTTSSSWRYIADDTAV